jgi:hypothetical protein
MGTNFAVSMFTRAQILTPPRSGYQTAACDFVCGGKRPFTFKPGRPNQKLKKVTEEPKSI